MQMLRQDNNGVNGKGPTVLRIAKGRTQKTDVIRQHTVLSVVECYGEETGTPGNPVAAVVNHPGLLIRMAMRIILSPDSAALHPGYGFLAGSPDAGPEGRNPGNKFPENQCPRIPALSAFIRAAYCVASQPGLP
jgi:hypothetical protein